MMQDEGDISDHVSLKLQATYLQWHCYLAISRLFPKTLRMTSMCSCFFIVSRYISIPWHNHQTRYREYKGRTGCWRRSIKQQPSRGRKSPELFLSSLVMINDGGCV